jgi:hypothetical protein
MMLYLLRSVRNAEIGLIACTADELKQKNKHFSGSAHLVILVICAKIVQTAIKSVIAIKFKYSIKMNSPEIKKIV